MGVNVTIDSKSGRCCVKVRAPQMNFAHFHQCTRQAVTSGPINVRGEIGPVCYQHSPEAAAKRAVKRAEADKRRSNQWYWARGINPPNEPS